MPTRATSSPDPYLNQLLGRRYRPLRLLGQGAMGRVYLAQDQQLGGVTVAVKVLSQALVDDEARMRFEREAQACAYLGQKSLHIVRVHDFGLTDAGIPFYVMEYLNGRTLRQILQSGPLSLAQFYPWARQIGIGLKAAHEGIFMEGRTVQVVHRDLKPGNILVVADDSLGDLVKIVDFGIAKLLSETGTWSVTQAYMGTLAYSSPEQLEGLPLDSRSDLYSLGVMMYEMISGALPILPETDSFPAWYQAHLKRHPRLLDPRQIPLPSGLQELILACLEKSPHDRPQSVAQVVTALDRIFAPQIPAGVSSATLGQLAVTQVDQNRPVGRSTAAQTLGTQRLGGYPDPEALEGSEETHWWTGLLPLLVGGALGVGSFMMGWHWLQGQFGSSPGPITSGPGPSPTQITSTPELPSTPIDAPQERPSNLEQISPAIPSATPASPQAAQPNPQPQMGATPKFALAIFPVGMPQVSVRDQLGQPQESGRGYWPNTTYDLYRRSVPDGGPLDLGLLYDRDTLALRQTEATVTDQMPEAFTHEILAAMLQADPPQEILTGLQQVRARVRDQFRFRFEILEGTIERNAQGRIYIATWEPDLHHVSPQSSTVEVDFQFELGGGSVFDDPSIPPGETLSQVRQEARDRRE